MEHSCLLSQMRNSCSVVPYTKRQLQDLDNERANFIKQVMGLPASTCNDLVFLPEDKVGLRRTSIVPIYTQIAADTLIHALEDRGRLGQLTRALTRAHIAAKTSQLTPHQETPRHLSLSCPDPRWKDAQGNFSMSLRKAAWIAYGGMKVDSPACYHPISDDTSVMEALAERCKMHRYSPSALDLVQHILIPLWQCNIYHLGH